jgi:predicted anti-sigma-YlaC factor YlaD
MLCSLTKRFVSRREDMGRPLPARLERHLRHCPKCREFDNFCASLRSRAKAESSVPSPADAARDARILSALKSGVPRKSEVSGRRKLIPVAALIGLLAVVVSVSIWLATPRKEPLPRLGALIDPERIEALRAEITSVDLPLKKEKEALDEVLGASVKYLVSRLDPGFGK